ncbi:substrate of the Dot/Icm secretion system [Legionella shakespearei DSM 23087]|uniref:Substrate of the Dot/Icm secretion system n=2 Tax=Legionella shakespearei TaxID=45075 RepID=A0A0W0Z1D7_9GAMM|nr:substrate of the Dot/Icm secretion system [Legionella shakespearei DSM 23087]
MRTITYDRCLQATKNGVFRFAELSTGSLTYDDLLFVADYLRRTDVNAIDVSMVITKENVLGLQALSQVISQKEHLTHLTFRAFHTELHLERSENILESIINYFSNKSVKKFNKLIYEAMLTMVDNKPHLQGLNIDLMPVETPLDKKKVYKFAKCIQNYPLSSLSLNFMVAENAKLPLLKKGANQTLTHLKLQRMAFGRDVFNVLQQTNALQSLVIEDMKFQEKDFQKIDTLLKRNKKLERLTLSQTNLGQIDCSPLFDSLKECTALRKLTLAENNLSFLNSTELCNYLAAAPNLAELDLHGNAYMAPDAIRIAHSLAGSTQISRLIVDGNYIEDDGLRAIIDMVHAKKQFSALSISHTFRYQPSDETIEHLCALFRDPECQLKEFSLLQKLPPSQLKKVCDAILDNKSLTQANIKYNFDSISDIIYKIKIQSHLDGLDPLEFDPAFLDMDDELEKPSEANQQTVSVKNLADTFFSSPKETSPEEEGELTSQNMSCQNTP